MANWQVGPVLDADQLHKATSVIIQGYMNEAEIATFIQEIDQAPKLQRIELVEALDGILIASMILFANVIQKPSLVKLAVTDTRLSLKAIELFCQGLIGSSIECLDVTNLGLGAEGGLYLGRGIRGAKKLVDVKAGNNQFQGAGIKHLISNPLFRLSIPDNDVHERDWPILLKKCRVYARLDISCAELTLTAMETLITKFDGLVDLKLNCINLYLSFKILCRGLQKSSLKILEIRNCQLGNYSIHFLCEVLKTNRSLEKIDMAKNQLGFKGQRELIKGLNLNYTLLHLIIDPLYHYPVVPIQTRLTPMENESVTALIIRLCLQNDTLHLRGFWAPQLHQYHPVSTHDRIILLLMMWPLPMDLAIYVFSFWLGVEGCNGYIT